MNKLLGLGGLALFGLIAYLTGNPLWFTIPFKIALAGGALVGSAIFCIAALLWLFGKVGPDTGSAEYFFARRTGFYALGLWAAFLVAGIFL